MFPKGVSRRQFLTVAQAILVLLPCVLLGAPPALARGAGTPPPQTLTWAEVSTAGPEMFVIDTTGPADERLTIRINGQPVRLHFTGGEVVLVLRGAPRVFQVDTPPGVTSSVMYSNVTVSTNQPTPVPPNPFAPRSLKTAGQAVIKLAAKDHWWDGVTGVVASFGGSKGTFEAAERYITRHPPTELEASRFVAAASAGEVPGETTTVSQLAGRNVVEVKWTAEPFEWAPADVRPAAEAAGYTEVGLTYIRDANGLISGGTLRYAKNVGSMNAVPVIKENGLTFVPDQGPAADSSAEVALRSVGEGPFWSAAGRAGRIFAVLGLATVAWSSAQAIYEVSQHNDVQGFTDLGQALGGALSFGAMDWGMAIGAAVGDVVGLVIGAAAGAAVGLVAPTILGDVGGWIGHFVQAGIWPWQQQSTTASIYAPDLFFVNTSGQPATMAVTEAGRGSYDVRPPWTRGNTWTGAVAPNGRWLPAGGGEPVAFLHYETVGPTAWQVKQGWVVAPKNFDRWARLTLARYGFPRGSIAVFLARWGQLARVSGTLVIYPQTRLAVLDSLAPLVTKPPAPTRRVWFAIRLVPSESPIGSPAAPRFWGSPHGPLQLFEWGVTFIGPVPSWVLKR